MVEDVRVVDGETTWDYFIDIGDKSEVEKGTAKKVEKVVDPTTQPSASESIIGLSEKIEADGGHTLIIGGTLKSIRIDVFSDPKSLNQLINDKRIEIQKSKGIDKDYDIKQDAF